MMARDLARALDPVLLAHDCGVEPDAWQADVPRSDAKRSLLLCSRQSGKTTTTGLKGLHKALYKPRSTTLILSPSQRQSTEMQRSVMNYCSRLRGIPVLRQESVMKSDFDNGSCIIALPGSGDTVRGFAAVDLVILDEAARIEDQLLAAVRPILATVNGELAALTTPKGKRGFFYEAWIGDGNWQRVKITADQCPRITKEFLAEEPKFHGPQIYAEEYFCEFLENDESVFPAGIIQAAFTTEVQPLWT